MLQEMKIAIAGMQIMAALGRLGRPGPGKNQKVVRKIDVI